MSVSTTISTRAPGGARQLPVGTPPRIWGAGASDTAPSTPADASVPAAQPSDTTSAIQTVADAYLAALGSQPQDAGATVVVPTPPIDGSTSGMNAKTILLIAALAAAAFFLYKKFGPSAASAS